MPGPFHCIIKEALMTKLLQVYKCEKCGNMVEVVHAGDGQLECCGAPMKLMEEGVVEASLEKHVPVIEKWRKGYHVKIGSARHPMEEKHNIEWIELLTDGQSFKRYLSPEDEPEAFFDEVVGDNVTARAYCNLHGLWKADNRS